MFLNKVLLLQYETAPLLYCLGFLAVGGFIVLKCHKIAKKPMYIISIVRSQWMCASSKMCQNIKARMAKRTDFS